MKLMDLAKKMHYSSDCEIVIKKNINDKGVQCFPLHFEKKLKEGKIPNSTVAAFGVNFDNEQVTFEIYID